MAGASAAPIADEPAEAEKPADLEKADEPVEVSNDSVGVPVQKDEPEPLPKHEEEAKDEPYTPPAGPVASEEPQVEPVTAETLPKDSDVTEDAPKANGVNPVVAVEEVAESTPESLPLAADTTSHVTVEDAPKDETHVQDKSLPQAPSQTTETAIPEESPAQPLESTPVAKSEPPVVEPVVQQKVIDDNVATMPANEETKKDVPSQREEQPENPAKSAEVIPPQAALKPAEPAPADAGSAKEPVSQQAPIADARSEPSSMSDANAKSATPIVDAIKAATAAEPASKDDASKPVAKDADEPQRPPTANQSVTSLTTHKRESFFRALWRAVFLNFFGGLFGAFRRRERPPQ
ncbi:hypothetical protein CIHG_03369 [Coccidioides immitis H538.4]|uniref:Uncharacterized protein n=1 Tax=Coccidioides immitis H538.4 TaxID=396776 RepID=A0A0J8RML4_COCIT|nr:hypothetical protein CIHG_03369 [Coccidioides immitis H538.4]